MNILKEPFDVTNNLYRKGFLVPCNCRILGLLLMLFAIFPTLIFGQTKDVNQLLNTPIKTITIKGDTFLQRDLTAYLDATIGKEDVFEDSAEYFQHKILRDYFPPLWVLRQRLCSVFFTCKHVFTYSPIILFVLVGCPSRA